MDSRKIEELSGFATFLEFLKNPQPVAEHIKELNAAVKDWKDANEKARGIKSVDDWRNRAQQEMSERQAALDSSIAQFEVRMTDEQAALAKSKESHAKARAKFAEEQNRLDAKLAEVDEMLKEKAELAKTERRLNEKDERLQAMDKDLKDRLAQIKKLMGGA